jgi:[protein-PII] uridylyltransferase
LPETPDPLLTGQLEAAVTLFYDIGLEVAPSVRTIEESCQAASDDLTVQTALLEARLLIGDEPLFRAFIEAINKQLEPATFYEAKRKEQDERHLRFQLSPYSLEPNCKEAPGGLRDLHMILWIARAAGFGGGCAGLAEHGLITPEEAETLSRCITFLQELRTRLHLHTGRREDRLLFDHQTALAEQFGLQATPTRRASELLMQKYYRTAKEVTQINTILLLNLGTAISPAPDRPPQAIDEHFQNANDLLDIVDEEVFSRRPELMLTAFLQLAHRLTTTGRPRAACASVAGCPSFSDTSVTSG